MSKREQVFIDTSFFKAIIDARDEFHTKASQIWKRFEKENIIPVTSNYILDETFTLIRVKCGVETAVKMRNLLVKSGVLKLVRVTVSDEASAWKWFERDWSGLSFTDCISFGVMERLNIINVATFDSHFSRAGFHVEK